MNCAPSVGQTASWVIVSTGAVAGDGSDADVTKQLREACFTTFDLPEALLVAMFRASSGDEVGAIKAMDGAADQNAAKTAADLPTGVDVDLARRVVAVVIKYCDEFADLSFTRKFLGLPANDAAPQVVMDNTSRSSGFFGLESLPYTLEVVRGLVAALRLLDDGNEVLCNSDGRVNVPLLYAVMHVAPKISPDIAQTFVKSDCVQNSVCFYLEAGLNFFREYAAGTVAATAAVVKRSWRDTARKAADNHLDFDWLDPRLWNLAALAQQLGKVDDIAVRLRLTFTLFKRLPPQHRQLVVLVPLRRILESPHLPTRVIADQSAGDTLSFLKGALTHVADRHDDTTALASIRKLTTDGASSIVVAALRNGGLKSSVTASVDVSLSGESLTVLTPHRDIQLGLLGFANTGVRRQPQRFDLAQPLELGSFVAFPTTAGCSGFAQGARFDVCAEVQRLLGLEPELNATAMEERLERMRAGIGALGGATTPGGGLRLAL